MSHILLCNSNPQESERVRKVLANRHRVDVMTQSNGSAASMNDFDAVVLDSNFSAESGIDFLMEVSTSSVIPVLYVASPDDPRGAIEARRNGAFNYLIKTSNLFDIMELAVSDMIAKFNDEVELKNTILDLQQRNAQLQNELTAARKSAPSSAPEGQTPNGARQSLIQEISGRLRRGEIDLPSFPSLSLEIAKLIREQASIDEIAAVLKKDMTVSAKLIGVANSPNYRQARPNTTLEQAINVLGLTNTKNYVDIIVNRALYATSDRKNQQTLSKLWKHGAACAQASKAIAVELKLPSPDEMFSIGLMHDIGKLLLLQIVFELEQREVFDANAMQEQRDGMLEKYHGIFGRKLLEKWKLPTLYADVAEHHESPFLAPGRSKELLAVSLGNLMARKAGYGDRTDAEDDENLGKIAAELELDEEAIKTLTKSIRTSMEQTGLKFE